MPTDWDEIAQQKEKELVKLRIHNRNLREKLNDLQKGEISGLPSETVSQATTQKPLAEMGSITVHFSSPSQLGEVLAVLAPLQISVTTINWSLPKSYKQKAVGASGRDVLLNSDYVEELLFFCGCGKQFRNLGDKMRHVSQTHKTFQA